jgi:hypothetical protein
MDGQAPVSAPGAGHQGRGASGWLETTTPDGRHGWELADMAGCEVADIQPCPTCGCLERWQDQAGVWHCKRCEPRGSATRLRTLSERVRARYPRLPRHNAGATA